MSKLPSIFSIFLILGFLQTAESTNLRKKVILEKESTQEWIYRQYKKIPNNEFAYIPHPFFKFDKQDRIYLDMNNSPILRNEYINSSYAQIAIDLQKCVGSNEIATWYHFAYWVSKSARSVLNGSKYNSLKLYEEVMIKVGRKLNISDYQEVVKSYGILNSIVAFQMIPLGKFFIRNFCEIDGKSRNQLISIDEFINKFKNYPESYRLIAQAFKYYYQASLKKDMNLKHEYIAFASSLQVIGEQSGVQRNLEEIFTYNGKTRVGELYYKYKMTQAGSLLMSENKRTMIELSKNLSTKFTHKDLKIIEFDQYELLMEQYQIEKDIYQVNQFSNIAVRDWSNLNKRLRYLVAVFRSYSVLVNFNQNPSL